MSAYYCSECGAEVGHYISFFGEGWMHVHGSDEANCSNVRGDRTWQPVEAESLWRMP